MMKIGDRHKMSDDEWSMYRNPQITDMPINVPIAPLEYLGSSVEHQLNYLLAT